MKASCIAVALALLSNPSGGADRLKALLDEIDDLWRGKSSEAVIVMKVKTEHYERTMKMRAWSKGKEKTLVRILTPLKEKGTATLKSGKNVYTYLPKTDRTIRLSSGMMGGAWMGSHFTNDDLVKESRLLDDYDGSITNEDAKIIELTLIPKEDAAVVWGKIVMTIGAKDHLPIGAVYYDEDMLPARRMIYSEIEKFGDRRMPAVMRVVPEDKKSEYTEMRYEKLAIDKDVSDGLFSLGKLRKR